MTSSASKHHSHHQQQQQQMQKNTVRMVGDYIVSKRIGMGSFANVWMAHHKDTGEQVAIKSINRERINLNKKHQTNLEGEIRIMKQLQHPNIVRMIEVHTTERHIYLILEFCAGGDLSRVIKRDGRIPEVLAHRLLLQLVAGLKVLQKRGLIHRDLKPQNLLLSSSDLHTATLKIADFGFARHIQPQVMAETLCGSPLYMAPEILRYQKYDAKADLWSVGTILYEMVCGEPPFNGTNHIQLLQRIETTDVSFPKTVDLSDACRSLLLGLLRRDPKQRMTYQQLFAHPFVGVGDNNNNNDNNNDGRKSDGTGDGDDDDDGDDDFERLQGNLTPVHEEETEPTSTPEQPQVDWSSSHRHMASTPTAHTSRLGTLLRPTAATTRQPVASTPPARMHYESPPFLPQYISSTSPAPGSTTMQPLHLSQPRATTTTAVTSTGASTVRGPVPPSSPAPIFAAIGRTSSHNLLVANDGGQQQAAISHTLSPPPHGSSKSGGGSGQLENEYVFLPDNQPSPPLPPASQTQQQQQYHQFSASSSSSLAQKQNAGGANTMKLQFSSEADAIETFQQEIKQSVLVVKLAENKENSGQRLKATALYVKACQIFHEMLARIRAYRSQCSDVYRVQLSEDGVMKLQSFNSWLVQHFNKCMAKLAVYKESLMDETAATATATGVADSGSNEFAPTTSKSDGGGGGGGAGDSSSVTGGGGIGDVDTSSSVVVIECAEKMLWDWGVQLAKDAAVDELMGANDSAMKKYKRATRVLMLLKAEKDMTTDDRNVLATYIHAFQNRINGLHGEGTPPI